MLTVVYTLAYDTYVCEAKIEGKMAGYICPSDIACNKLTANQYRKILEKNGGSYSAMQFSGLMAVCSAFDSPGECASYCTQSCGPYAYDRKMKRTENGEVVASKNLYYQYYCPYGKHKYTGVDEEEKIIDSEKKR